MGYTFKRITKQQYEQLRANGASREEILRLDNETSVDKFLKIGSKIANFIGARKVAETFGSEIAQAKAPTQFEKNNISASAPSVGETAGSALQTAALFVPGGQATLPGRVAAGAAAGYAMDVGSDLQKGKTIDESLKPGAGALIGGGIPIVAAGAKIATKVVSKTMKNIAAALSGKGTKVMDAVLDNPQAALEGLRGEASLQQNAMTVRQTVSQMSKKASDEFKDDLASLPKRLGRTPSVVTEGGKTTIRVDGKNYTLSLQGAKSKLTSELRKFGVQFDPKKKAFDFLESPLDRAESGRLQEVFDVIDSWKDTSPEGFHKLARKISNFRKAGEQSRELNSIIDSVSRNVRDYIGDRVPAAKEMLSKYAKAQDIIEAFDQEFATAGRFVGGTADRIDTEKRIANLFSGEKGSTLNLLEENVPGGKDIIAREAGRELSEGLTRASSSIGDFLASAVRSVISPRVVGQLVARTGMTATKAEAILRSLQGLEGPTRGVVLSIVAALTADQQPR